ncbi:MAG: PD-(D/E)XK nuclease family protein [Chthoniobacterales bacterium]
MQLEFELQPARGPALLIAESAEAAWQGGVGGWFARIADQAWKTERPAVVIVPTRGQAQALKARLLEANLSALGVQFFTPPHLRILLAGNAEILPPPREHLRLLLALAAEETLAAPALSEPERLAAISVRRTPAHLLHLLEQLSAAGADFRVVDLPAFRPVVRKFRAHLSAAQFDLFPESDRGTLARAQQNPPALSHLLITGFNGAHWPLWHLLHAAVRAAEHATVVLQYPREAAADLEVAWIGTWEESLGEAQPLARASEAPASEREPLFLAGLDTREQAEAITAAAHQFLAQENCTRLGIVVPAAGALSRLVASVLTAQGIPHYDAVGQLAPGLFEAPDFWSWMELQRTPRLNALLRFLTALPSDHPLFEKISRRHSADALQRALGELALDDLTVLTLSARGRDAKGELISATLTSLHFLPDRATFSEFLRATADAFARLGWSERWREIEQRATWTTRVAPNFSRTLFLQWLEEIAVSFRVTRDLIGQHPYARVQLLTPAQAEDQSWSHLILAGLNENAWPATARGDFLPAAQIDALNQSVQKINRAATRRGRQGEGHVTVRDDATLFLGATQQRQLALAQFASLIESATHGLALTASLVQEATPERISNPSEFFSRLYHEVHGQSVSQTAMRALREQTRRWLDEAALEPPQKHEPTPAILQTSIAYSARREIAASGEYDFALRVPPNEIKPLSVSDTEALLKSPALIWMERYLGVEGAEDSTYVWNATIGKWTHDWLASILGKTESFIAFPPAETIAPRILAAAERKRAEVRELCRQSGRTIPDWWDSGWENALCLAQTLGRLLGAIEGWPWAVSEWRLEAQPIAVGEGRSLLLRGRADLLLGQTAAQPKSLSLPTLWIVDFKTGNKKSIKPTSKKKDDPLSPKVRKQILKADPSLQLGLYALAVKQLGAERVALSILSPVINRPEPQLHDDDFSECHAAFIELARMQATGIFGMKGSLRGAFTFTKDYPLATLAIDPEIIDERWERTHPDLVAEDESWT